MTHMSTPRPAPRADADVDSVAHASSTPASASASASSSTTTFSPPSYAPPTYAAFSPANLSSSAAATAAKRTSTILVHQKSPLLLATPPQVTRALAYSHPFLLPLNKFVGLVSWTTGDTWESFLLLAAFWAVVQYGDFVLRFAGPIVVVVGLIAGMYARRYSPLSSSGWAEHPSPGNSKDKKKATNAASISGQAGSGHQRNASEATSTRHQKTLDEIVETLILFTSRCNILLEPLLEMTDFLSTQRTATIATTRPALTTLFVRILAITPIWVALTLPPLRIITTRRVVLVFGTLVLSWHSRVCRVARTLLWRSATVRKLARWITGLPFERPGQYQKEEEAVGGQAAGGVAQQKGSQKAAKISSSALTEALKRSQQGSNEAEVRFTFILYENQRRWVGLGWTNSLFAYERSTWTDEQNNPTPTKDKFELPEADDGRAKWRWVRGSRWRVDGLPELNEADYNTEAGKMGWIFYDNKWQNGRRGNEGWGRWTRRRKWYRDAELVEASDDNLPSRTPPALPARPRALPSSSPKGPNLGTHSASAPDVSSLEEKAKGEGEDDAVSILSTSSKSTKFRFTGPFLGRRSGGAPQPRPRRTSEATSLRSNDDDSTLDPALELEIQGHQRDQGQWGIGDDAQMGLE